MDVNEGNEYTPIGSYDNMSAKDLTGAEGVILRNQSYVSDIKLWEKWGLLKVAYTGIKNELNEVVALTGADIDVSIISKKTKEALIQSIFIGILALILGILASYYIAIKIIRPIETLKASALKIAAGNYGDKVLIQSPQELQELSVEFNHMSNQLASTMNKKYDMSTTEKNKNLPKTQSKKTELRNVSIEIEGLKESKYVVGFVEIANTIAIYAIEPELNSILEINKKRIMMNTLLEKALISNKLSKLSKIFDFTDLFIIDTNNLKLVKNICQDDETTIQNTHQTQRISIKNTTISITKKEKNL